MSEWLTWVTYITQSRYAGAYLTAQAFDGRQQYTGLWQNAEHNCSVPVAAEQFTCRYPDGSSYVNERYPATVADPQINLVASFLFPVAAAVFNILLYVAPLPSYIKAKFREWSLNTAHHPPGPILKSPHPLRQNNGTVNIMGRLFYII